MDEVQNMDVLWNLQLIGHTNFMMIILQQNIFLFEYIPLMISLKSETAYGNVFCL